MAETAGVVYLRPTRDAYPGLYPHDERFVVGGSEVHGDRPDDEAALLSAGATCTPASGQRGPRIHREGHPGDRPHSVKPLDVDSVMRAAQATRAVRDIPGPGSYAELVEAAGTSLGYIARAAARLVAEEVDS